jgi:hypothetical protein
MSEKELEGERSGMRLVLMCVLLCAVWPYVVNAQTMVRVEQPAVEAGDWWQYETTTFPAEGKTRFRLTVDEVTRDSIKTSTPRTKATWRRDWALLESITGQETTLRGDPPRLPLQFPLEVGKRWNDRAVVVLPNVVRRWQGE